jgi:riboflavin synthase
VPVHAEDLEHTDWRMTLQVPNELAGHIIPQGSITVDGISLTVAKQDGLRIEIAVIPHTYKVTNLRTLLSGALVNLETDVLSKYAAKKAAAEIPANPAPVLHAATKRDDEWLTPEYLLANGY